MDQQWMGAMAEATRLTRQGRLAEATALIQRDAAKPAARRAMAATAGSRCGRPWRGPVPVDGP